MEVKKGFLVNKLEYVLGPSQTYILKDIQMRAPKTATYYISPIEIGLLWAKITYVKSHLKALGFNPQTDTK